MKTLAKTLEIYIAGESDMNSNMIEILIEVEFPQFPLIEQDWIMRELKPYEFENERGEQVFAHMNRVQYEKYQQLKDRLCTNHG